jgi:hypothetical protein
VAKSRNLLSTIHLVQAPATPNAPFAFAHELPVIPRGALVIRAFAPDAILSRSGGAASSLATSFIGGWEFENEFVLGADSGPNALLFTNSGTTQNASGQVGAADACVRTSSQYLFHADAALLKTGGAFTWAGWLYLTSKPAAVSMDPISKGSAAGGSNNYFLRYNTTSDRFLGGFLKSDSSGFALATANTFGAASISTWYFVVLWYDPSLTSVFISVNNGAADSGATALGPIQTADMVAFGRAGAFNGNYWNGRLDQLMFWKRALTAAERTTLYNSGAGLSVADALSTPTGVDVPWDATYAYLQSSVGNAQYYVKFFT